MGIEAKNLFWFRRDLRITDNRALYEALADGKTICCFIWDTEILNKLKPNNPRVQFIDASLKELKSKLKTVGSDLIVEFGLPDLVLSKLVKHHKIKNVYANEDYEPYAIIRDKKISATLNKQNCNLFLFQDHLIFAKLQLLNKTNKPYIVYTPYKNSWLANLTQSSLQTYPSEKLLSNLVKASGYSLTELKDLGFSSNIQITSGEIGANYRLSNFLDHLDDYHKTRDFPGLNATSHLGVDLRFGTISIRTLVSLALSRLNQGGDVWLSEFIWREFFSQILYNFPYVINQPFRKELSQLNYQYNQSWFDSWCNGTTGFPIVDAGMRELNQTGFMHNRVRMICASFLTKDLLIDWRYGEAYFAEKLLDYELASNNGNWQWCASTGCDAQPYFRVFNPTLQAKKFDPEGVYIKKYVSELANIPSSSIHDSVNYGVNYYKPIVNHSVQSKLAIEMFKQLKNN